MQEFEDLARIRPNMKKTAVYLAGCTEELKKQIFEVLDIKEDALLMRYLGVPLVTSRLTRRDCIPLV